MKKKHYTKPVAETTPVGIILLQSGSITEKTSTASTFSNGELDSNSGSFFEEEGSGTHDNLWE